MSALSTYPSFSFPKKLIFKIAYSLIVNKKRSITFDSKSAISGIIPPIQIKGEENIPLKGPGLVTLNHYSRPGFSIMWAAAAISAQLPENQIWLMTNAWTKRTPGIDQLRTGITRILFKLLAAMYGLITTPPMPPAPDELTERALSIRKIIKVLRENPDTILCIAPEGQDIEFGKLGIPPTGTGKFVFEIQKQLKQIIPVGVWEENERLVLKFGEPYTIENSGIYIDIEPEISNLVMNQIANLLPDNFL